MILDSAFNIVIMFTVLRTNNIKYRLFEVKEVHRSVRFSPRGSYTRVAFNFALESKEFLSLREGCHGLIADAFCVSRITDKLYFIVHHQDLLPIFAVDQAKVLFNVVMNVNNNLLHQDCTC